MQIDVQHDLDSLEKNLDALGRKVFRPAINSALNKTGTKKTNESVTEVSIIKRVKRKLIKERVRIRRSNVRILYFEARANYRGITWHSLGAKVIKGRGKSKRTFGIKAGTGKNAHKHPGAFLGVSSKSGNEQVFIRKTYERKPLEVLRISLYQPFQIAFKRRMKSARKEFLVTLHKELRYRTAKELSKKHGTSNRT